MMVYRDLEPATEKLHIRARSQAGFRAGCRVEDNLLILRTIENLTK